MHEIMNFHCSLLDVSIYMNREMGFPHNAQWSRLTYWLGLNLIQDLDRHILEAYCFLWRFPQSNAYNFFFFFFELIGFGGICLINWLVKSL